MHIRDDDLTGEKTIQLLQEHLDNMQQVTPPGSVHALDLSGLRAANVSFWSVWDGDTLLGCGALKELDKATGEVKSMRTKEAQRGRGVAKRMLEHIIRVATARGYTVLNLETGSQTAFLPARTLYARYGFEVCGPLCGLQRGPQQRVYD